MSHVTVEWIRKDIIRVIGFEKGFCNVLRQYRRRLLWPRKVEVLGKTRKVEQRMETRAHTPRVLEWEETP